MQRAALRPFSPTPVLVPPTCVGLPNRDAEANASPPELASGCIVRIDVHGSKDRAKDASPEHMHDFRVLASGACALWRMRDGVPLLGALRASAVIGATSIVGGCPQCSTDRPRSSFRQHPAKSVAFQTTRMSFTATTREGVNTRRDESLRPSRRLSRSRRPHFVHRVCGLCFRGALQGHGSGHPQSVISRVQTPF
jgi:hypothetical protein